MNRHTEEEKYQPVVFNALGQKIYEFCQCNPQIIFNAPPDYQSAFIEATEGFPAALKYINRLFFENQPIVEFLKRIKSGDRCLMFIPDNRLGGITLLSEIKNIYKTDDIPSNWRLDMQPTRNFRRYFGEGGMWASCIAAIAKTSRFKSSMCWQDPEAKIFMEKALKDKQLGRVIETN